MPEIDTGNTAWVLASAALVLLMTPGLALFYGGMVREKSVLNMMMMSFGALALISVLWVLFGFSLAFGNSVGGLFGNPFDFWGMKDLLGTEQVLPGLPGLPSMAFVAFQAVFAIITVALISGAIADRVKFSAWMVFAGLWATIVYFPVAHWVFAFDGIVADSGGWIANDLKAIDFAGGTAVHINAGAAALALVIVTGKRVGWPKEPMKPHNLTLVMIGAGLLWFGWFGFNAGSELGADITAAGVWVNTMVATGAAALGWLGVEQFRDGKPTSLGAASGIVAGLVAITPACSSVNAIGAIVIGVVAGAVCALAVGLKYRLGYDDSLDVVGVHFVGGWIGTLMIGLFCTSQSPLGAAVNPAAGYGDLGLLYGGGFAQLGRQFVAAAVVTVFSFTVAFILGKAIDMTMGMRITDEDEVSGIDLSEHAEAAYDLGGHGGAGTSFSPSRTLTPNSEKVDA